ncbi:MAG: hypothetical protein Q7T81_08310 [Pseudolabrys sp.]|nr:hypothetical protein [Pseudolabrys sp.]
MVGFRSIAAKVGPAGIGQQTQLQKLQAKRAGMAQQLNSMQSRLSSITSALAQAQINRVSGEATNAAQAGVNRVNDMKDAAMEARNKQIDAASSRIAAVQSRVNMVA